MKFRHYNTLRQEEIRDAIVNATLTEKGGLNAIVYRMCKNLSLDTRNLGAPIDDYKTRFHRQVAKHIAELESEGILFPDASCAWSVSPKMIEKLTTGARIVDELHRGSLRVFPALPESNGSQALTFIGKLQRNIIDIFIDQQRYSMPRADLIKEALATAPPGTKESTITHALRSLDSAGEGYLECPSSEIIALTQKGNDAILANKLELQCCPEHQVKFYDQKCPVEQIRAVMLYVLASQGYNKMLELRDIHVQVALTFDLDPNVHVAPHPYRISEFDDRCEKIRKELHKAGHISSPYAGKNYFRLTDDGWNLLREYGKTLQGLGKSLSTLPIRDLEELTIAEPLEESQKLNSPVFKSKVDSPRSDSKKVEEYSSDRCFWCRDLLNASHDGFYVTVDRTVIDNSGCHIEITPFCLPCARISRELLAAPVLKYQDSK